ncbi:MAG: hypothetical protein LBR41_03475 [Rickettsiales bacterium]|nr:hypothetical protein [Rickettsiales bacterium]
MNKLRDFNIKKLCKVFGATFLLYSILYTLYSVGGGDAVAATVIQRGTPAPAAARSRPSATVSAPVRADVAPPVPAVAAPEPAAVVTISAPIAAEPTPVSAPVTVSGPIAAPVSAPTPSIPDRSSYFADIFAAARPASAGGPTSGAALRDSVRAQRAAADIAATGGAITSARSTCDADLRGCMIGLCGDDTYSKCWTDNSIEWNRKMTSCRAKSKCTTAEFDIIAPEFILDRDQFSSDSSFTIRTTCNINHNNCILQNCGRELKDCQNEAGQNRALAACPISRECEMVDNGMVGRSRSLFAALRIDYNEEQFANRQRMRELVDIMRNECAAQKGSYDEEGMTCVYSVELAANVYQNMVDRGRVDMGQANMVTLASRKLYAAAVYQCTEDWFGVDISTYMENAERRTANDRIAYNSALASGLAGAAGTVTNLASSGAYGQGSAWDAPDKAAEKQPTPPKESSPPKPGDGPGNQNNPLSGLGGLAPGQQPQEPATETGLSAREQRQANRAARRAARNNDAEDQNSEARRQLKEKFEQLGEERFSKIEDSDELAGRIRAAEATSLDLEDEYTSKNNFYRGYDAYVRHSADPTSDLNDQNRRLRERAEEESTRANVSFSNGYNQGIADSNNNMDKDARLAEFKTAADNARSNRDNARSAENALRQEYGNLIKDANELKDQLDDLCDEFEKLGGQCGAENV